MSLTPFMADLDVLRGAFGCKDEALLKKNMGMGFMGLRDGVIVEAWNTFDFQSLNEPLGLGAGAE